MYNHHVVGQAEAGTEFSPGCIPGNDGGRDKIAKLKMNNSMEPMNESLWLEVEQGC